MRCRHLREPNAQVVILSGLASKGKRRAYSMDRTCAHRSMFVPSHASARFLGHIGAALVIRGNTARALGEKGKQRPSIELSFAPSEK